MRQAALEIAFLLQATHVSVGDDCKQRSCACRYAMKTLEKAEMLERNKVMRVLTEARILSAVDHPFLASLYGTITTDTHLHFLMQICEGGELYALLTSQPNKRFKESHVRFYTAEVRACMPVSQPCLCMQGPAAS